MASLLLKNRFTVFILRCVSLSSPGGITAVLGTAIAALFFINPEQFNWVDLCLIKKVFGHCPACGTTRALACFFKGRFAESVKYNLNVVLAAPMICGIFLENLIKAAMQYIKTEKIKK
jgi:hypothetical protein